jgi:DNA-directed RNA polymerase delta subunit
MLRNVCFHNSYASCTFRFHAEFFEPLRMLAAAVRRRKGGVLSISDWERLVRRVLGITPKQLKHETRLILALLGLRLIDSKRETASTIFASVGESDKVLRRARREIKLVLTNGFPQGLTVTRLRAYLQSKLGSDTLLLSEVAAIARSVASIEFDPQTYRFRARPGFLQHVADEYERVLRAAGKPMHYREICSKTAGTKGGKRDQLPRDVGRMLSFDPRFTPIGGSGFWSLTEWTHVETRKVVSVAVDLLEKAGKPLHHKKLFRLISRLRPVSKSSIENRLGEDPRLIRVGRGTWGLAKRKR